MLTIEFVARYGDARIRLRIRRVPKLKYPLMYTADMKILALLKSSFGVGGKSYIHCNENSHNIRSLQLR